MSQESNNKSTPTTPSSTSSAGGSGFDAHVVNRIFDRLEKLDGKFHEISVAITKMDSKADRLHSGVHDQVCRVEKTLEQQTTEIRRLNDWKTRIMAIAGFIVIIIGVSGTIYKLMS